MNTSNRPTASYEEFAPDPSLQHWIAYSWSFRALEAGTHPIPPEPGFTLSALPDLGHVSLRGPHDHAIEVEAPEGLQVFGLRFWPGTFAGVPSVAAIDPQDWVGREEPADAWVPEMASSLLRADAEAQKVSSEAPSETTSTSRASESSAEQRMNFIDHGLARIEFDSARLDHDIVAAAFRLLGAGANSSVGAIAQSVGLSDRQFRRRFRQAVGLSPRAFRRARRIRLALEQAVLPSSTAWIELAGSHGYADQAHLCREFRRTTGRTPRSYVESVGHIEHHLVTRGRNVQDTARTRPLD